jgi:hypothetical protein
MLKRRLRTRRLEKRDKGAVALEFALIVPILLMISVAIIEFGRAYHEVISLQAAAREGARALALASVDYTPEDLLIVKDVVSNATVIPISDSNIVLTPCTVAGGQAEILVTKQFSFGIPFLPDIGTVDLSGDAAMRCGL